MLGETRFAFAHVWSLLSQCDGNARLLNLAFETYYDADDSEETARDPLPEKYKTLLPTLQHQDGERKAQILRETLDRWFHITDSDSKAWGFKEIWNGGSEQFDWNAYNKLFPEALWLHIVRHPAHQARSAAAHMGVPLCGRKRSQPLKSSSPAVTVRRQLPHLPTLPGGEAPHHPLDRVGQRAVDLPGLKLEVLERHDRFVP